MHANAVYAVETSGWISALCGDFELIRRGFQGDRDNAVMLMKSCCSISSLVGLRNFSVSKPSCTENGMQLSGFPLMYIDCVPFSPVIGLAMNCVIVVSTMCLACCIYSTESRVVGS